MVIQGYFTGATNLWMNLQHLTCVLDDRQQSMPYFNPIR